MAARILERDTIILTEWEPITAQELTQEPITAQELSQGPITDNWLLFWEPISC